MAGESGPQFLKIGENSAWNSPPKYSDFTGYPPRDHMTVEELDQKLSAFKSRRLKGIICVCLLPAGFFIWRIWAFGWTGAIQALLGLCIYYSLLVWFSIVYTRLFFESDWGLSCSKCKLVLASPLRKEVRIIKGCCSACGHPCLDGVERAPRVPDSRRINEILDPGEVIRAKTKPHPIAASIGVLLFGGFLWILIAHVWPLVDTLPQLLGIILGLICLTSFFAAFMALAMFIDRWDAESCLVLTDRRVLIERSVSRVFWFSHTKVTTVELGEIRSADAEQNNLARGISAGTLRLDLKHREDIRVRCIWNPNKMAEAMNNAVAEWRQQQSRDNSPPPPEPEPPASPVAEPEFDPYEILGLARTATFKEIKQARNTKVMENHPDRVAHLGPELRALAERNTKLINQAFDSLSKKFPGQSI